MTKVQILIVEDEAIVAEDMKNTLESMGYIVSGTVASGEEAIERTRVDKPDIVLMDIMLQGEMDGIEAAHQIRTRYGIPIVFLSSCGDEATLKRAKVIEPYYYIDKPFNEGELSATIEIVLCRQKMINNLKVIFDITENDLEQTISALALTPEIRDTYTLEHQRKVASLTYALAKELDLSDEYCTIIRKVSVIHDIGKITIPPEILSKPEKLTDSEFTIVKSHAQIGYDMLKNIEFPWPIADIISQHHERLDGSGYPGGLIESEIYLGSRILAVADVVEAMSSPRPYRPAYSLKRTLEEISLNRDILYDPLVSDACLELFNGKEFRFDA